MGHFVLVILSYLPYKGVYWVLKKLQGQDFLPYWGEIPTIPSQIFKKALSYLRPGATVLLIDIVVKFFATGKPYFAGINVWAPSYFVQIALWLTNTIGLFSALERVSLFRSHWPSHLKYDYTFLFIITLLGGYAAMVIVSFSLCSIKMGMR